MGGGEGIVDIEIAEGGEGVGECAVIGLFAGMEACVFQKQDAAVLQSGYGVCRRLADAIGCEGDGPAGPFGDGGCDRLQ